VALILEARKRLGESGVRARVVSMPSHNLFAEQSVEYRREVLPPGIPRVAIEAAHPMSWQRWVGDEGVVIGIERYGASAPYADIYKGLGLTVEKIVESARGLVARG
jgi:transketolase